MGPLRSIWKSSLTRKGLPMMTIGRAGVRVDFPTTDPNLATVNLDKFGGIGKLTLLPSSISTGLSQREKKISFFELEIGRTFRSSEFLWEIRTSKSVGRKLSHTISDCAAALKIRETADDLQASDGVVRDKMLAITPSGREDKSPISSFSVPVLVSSSSSIASLCSIFGGNRSRDIYMNTLDTG